jgi:hypothetical protein
MGRVGASFDVRLLKRRIERGKLEGDWNRILECREVASG